MNKSILHCYLQFCRFELLAVQRQLSQFINPLLFFILIISLFPLGLDPKPDLLQTIAPGIIWVAALLSTLLGMNLLFKQDWQQGLFDKVIVSKQGMVPLLLAKISVHWLLTGLPLVIVSPIVAIMLNMNMTSLGTLVISLLIGTPILSLLGAVIVSLTMGLKQSGLLMPLLLLPLFIPILIFGASAVIAAQAGLAVNGQLAILAAMLVIAITFLPWLSAMVIRIGVAE